MNFQCLDEESKINGSSLTIFNTYIGLFEQRRQKEKEKENQALVCANELLRVAVPVCGDHHDGKIR